MGSNSASSSTFAFSKRRICGCGGNVVLIKSKTTNYPRLMFGDIPIGLATTLSGLMKMILMNNWDLQL
ncbi:hypothetical protein SESBI_48733 [Sesbania bispinosa]|nr:hypothetical protein SESBI_48733 [Sesbania bispinosa]